MNETDCLDTLPAGWRRTEFPAAVLLSAPLGGSDVPLSIMVTAEGITPTGSVVDPDEYITALQVALAEQLRLVARQSR